MFMRIIVFIVFLFFVSATLLSAEMTGKIKLLIDIPYTLVIKNQSLESIPLYLPQSKSKKMIANLPPGNTMKYQYQGNTGKWKYGLYQGVAVSVHSKYSEKGSLILNKWFLASSLLGNIFTVSMLSCFVIFAMWLVSIFGRWLKVEREQPVNHQAIYHYNESKEKEDEVVILNDKVGKLGSEIYMLRKSLAREKHLRDSDKQNYLDEKEKTNAKHASALDSMNSRFNTDISSEKEAVRKEFYEQERKLKDKFELESIKRINVGVAEMQSSLNLVQSEYDTLKESYESIVRDGFTFDIDFKSDKYDGLLKGRRFEIYFAKKLLTTPGYEILEWTSDKGFENGIPVKSNGNPDLVVSYNGRFKFAIECKYRGTYFKRGGLNLISWAETWQADRYKTFSEDRNIPVLVAIGFGENSFKPSKLICSSLDVMINYSEIIEVSKNSNNKSNIQYMLDENSTDNLLLESYRDISSMADNAVSLT